jgi:phosphoribosylaminoimidazole-succinocarboxamide synthase
MLQANRVLSKRVRDVGLELAYAKLEFGVDQEGEIIVADVADVAGTPDETRFLLDGHHISKQILRMLHAGSDFRERVFHWANNGRTQADKPVPDPLPRDHVQLVSDIYQLLSQRWIGEPLGNAAPLEELMPQLLNLNLARAS